MSNRIARRPWKVRLAAGLAASSLLVAACGGTGDDGGNAASTPSGGGGATAGAPTRGGRVVYGLEADTTNFCMPDAQLAIAGIQVARSVYDTLTIPADDGTFHPYLAKSIEHNEDHTEWTIVLRDDVVFHDGTPLDAQVVKNNLDAYRAQYLGPDGQPIRLALLFRFVFGDVSDVSTKGDDTVVVKTAKPWVDFDAALYSSGRIGMVSQSQLDDKDTCATRLVGTGPFRVVGGNITDTKNIVLERNDDYWQTDANGVQLPYLDGLEFRAIPEATQRLNALQNGQIQAMHTSDGSSIAQVRDLARSGQLAVTEADDRNEVAYWLLNSSTPPFDNKLAREAVALAFDAEKFVTIQQAGVHPLANGPFAPGSIGHLADTGLPTFDLDAAKAKVAEYKAQTGQDLSFTLTSTNDSTTTAGAQLMQQIMRDAGISVQLASTEQSTLISDAVGGRLQMFGWRNHPGGTSPDQQMVWWHSAYPTNFGKINDPVVDSLLEKGRGTSEPGERKQIYEDLNRHMAENLYNVWNYWVVWAVATSPKVGGIWGPDLPGTSGPAIKTLAEGHPTLGLYINQ